MPVTLRCPHCRAKVTARPSPNNKPIRCPECERKFTPPDDDDEPEVDETPQARKRRDDDDDVELPRKRKVRTGKRKKKKKRSALPRILFPVAGLALMLVVGVVLYLYVVRPLMKGTGKDASGDFGPVAKERPEADLLAWVPSDSANIAFVNHRALKILLSLQHSPYRNGMGGMKVVPSGIDIDELDAAMHASRPGRPDSLYVLRLKAPNAEAIDRAIAGCGGQPRQVGTQTVYQNQRYTMYRASDRILVVTDRRDHIEGCIRTNTKGVVIMGDILELVNRAAADSWTVSVSVGTYRIMGSECHSHLAKFQVGEDGAMLTNEINYAGEVIATQAVARERANNPRLEIQQDGPRVIYRQPNSTAAGGIGISAVGWRW
jgi:hypothetical protein